MAIKLPNLLKKRKKEPFKEVKDPWEQTVVPPSALKMGKKALPEVEEEEPVLTPLEAEEELDVKIPEDKRLKVSPKGLETVPGEVPMPKEATPWEAEFRGIPGLGEAPAVTEDIFRREWTEEDLWQVRHEIYTNTAHFMRELFAVGRNEDTEGLLRRLGATDENIEAIFEGVPSISRQDVLGAQLVEPLLLPPLLPEEMTGREELPLLESIAGMPVEQTTVPVRLSDGTVADMVMDADGTLYFQGEEVGYVDQEGNIQPREFELSDVPKYFVSGIGNLLTGVGSTMDWLGEHGIAQQILALPETLTFQKSDDLEERLDKLCGDLISAGQALERQAPAVRPLGDFHWTQIFNPTFWLSTGPEILPMTLALIPLFFVGGAAGGAAATAVGVGAGRLGLFARTLIQLLSGATASRIGESALEAGTAFQEALNKGMSREEAASASDDVFKWNMSLMGLDAAQWALSLSVPSRAVSNMVRLGLVRTATSAAGKLSIVGLTEAGEELVQAYITAGALGDKFSFSDPDVQMQGAAGFLMGVTMFGFGQTYSRLTQETIGNLSPEARAAYEEMLTRMSQEEALDEVIGTPEGKRALETAVDQIKRDEFYSALTQDSSEAEKLAWQRVLRPSFALAGTEGEGLPRPIEGEPEAGIQAGMEGIAKEKVVRPAGAPEVQASLEGYAQKIEWEQAAIGEQAQEVIEAQPEEVTKIFKVIRPQEQQLKSAFTMMGYENREAFKKGLLADLAEIEAAGWEQYEAEGIREFLKTDPVANYRGAQRTVTTKKGTKYQRGRTLVSLLEHGQWPETLSQAQAKVLLMGRELKPSSVNAQGRVPWERILDELAEHFGMTEQQLIDHIEYIRQAQVASEDAQALSNMAREREHSINEMLRILETVESETEARTVTASLTDEVNELYNQIRGEIEALEKYAKSGVAEGAELAFANKSLKSLKSDLTGLTKMMKSFKEQATVTDRQEALRQTVMSWARLKGLPESQYRRLFQDTTGHRQLHLMSEEQLNNVLSAIKRARPKRIGNKLVITPKTEKKIQTLKATLIAEKSLTEESYERLKTNLGLKTDKYENARLFITESEALSLIGAMNDEAPLVKWEQEVNEALDRNPELRETHDGLIDRFYGQTGVEVNNEPIEVGRGSELRAMRYYMMLLQQKMKAPVYDIWQRANRVRHAMIHKRQLLLNDLEASIGEEAFKAIIADNAALARIENYIASKHKMGPPAPEDITATETALADRIEKQLFQFRNDVRYARFTEAYAGHGGQIEGISADIPDAPKQSLRRAIDVFESRGATALREYLDTQEWGIIRSGYNPLAIVKPKLYLHPPRATTFARGHIQTREGTEFTQEDRNIIDRYMSYQKQLMGLTDLSPIIRVLDRVFTANAEKITNSKHVASVISRGLNELKGYHEEGGAIVYFIERLYAQTDSAVFWRPDLAVRNLFQNLAFNPDFHMGMLFHPQNKFLSAERRAWEQLFVYQNRSIEQDYLLRYYRPIKGLGWLTRLANKTSLFPFSDRINRDLCFYVRINRVDRALKKYHKDGNIEKLMTDSGLRDLGPRQQAEALEYLARDEVDYGVPGMEVVSGEEAFARYIAHEHTNNVHFLYDRAERSPAEMGAAGKTLGNILVFQRSWGERLLLQAAKLKDPNATRQEKQYAAQIIIGVIVVGMLVGMLYQRITGKHKNPYNVINVILWGPGGLALGVTEEMSSALYSILGTLSSDEPSLDKVISGLSSLTRVSELIVPFYRNLMLAIESITDLKNVDTIAWKKLRDWFDENYELDIDDYEAQRDLIERLQHGLLGGEAKEPSDMEKLQMAEAELSLPIDIEDEPYSIEEPELYDMQSFGSYIARVLKDIPLTDVTIDNGYSVRVVAWAQKEIAESTYETYPNVPLYQINADPSEGNTFEEYYKQWQSIQRGEYTLDDFEKAYLGNFGLRTLELLREYHGFLDEDEQKEWLDEHPELKQDLRDEWLKSNPTENALLALFGQVSLKSVAAYDEFERLVVDLDIPPSIEPEFMPRNIFEWDLEYEELPDTGEGANKKKLKWRVAHPEYEEYMLETGRFITPAREQLRGSGGGMPSLSSGTSRPSTGISVPRPSTEGISEGLGGTRLTVSGGMGISAPRAPSAP